MQNMTLKLRYATEYEGESEVDETEVPAFGLAEFDMVIESTLTVNVESDVVGAFVDWGDGNTTETNGTSVSHTYAAGDYTLKIDNTFTGTLKITNASIYFARYLPAQATLLNLGNNKLNTATVNAILQFYDAVNTENYQLNLDSQTPSAPPSGAGITAKDNLIAKGWTVNTD
jgi:hypothetical protein